MSGQIMTAHHLRKSSMYRFHDSVRSERKCLIVALTSALILMAVISGLVFEFLHATPK
jgi:hypothetical protein